MIALALAAFVSLADSAPSPTPTPAVPVPPECVSNRKLRVDAACAAAIQNLAPGDARAQMKQTVAPLGESRMPPASAIEPPTSAQEKEQADKYADHVAERAKEDADIPFLHGDLVVGTVFASSSAKSPFSHAIQPTYVRWMSLPFGVLNRGKDRHQWRIFGRFGLMPVTTFIEPSEAQLKSGAALPESTEAKAFSWNAGIRYDKLAGQNTNVGLHVAAGQGILLKKTEEIEGPDGKTTSVAVADKVFDSVAGNFEIGAAVSVFTTSRDDRLLGLSPDPVASLVFGYRRDSRFIPREGTLGYDAPQHRLFVRFAVDLPLITTEETAEKGKTDKFSARFAVEYERPYRDGPSVTRILIGGSLNAFDELTGKKKKDESGAAKE